MFGLPLREKPVKQESGRGSLMAKKSKIVREHKIIKKVQKYAALRAELKGIIKALIHLWKTKKCCCKIR